WLGGSSDALRRSTGARHPGSVPGYARARGALHVDHRVRLRHLDRIARRVTDALYDYQTHHLEEGSGPGKGQRTGPVTRYAALPWRRSAAEERSRESGGVVIGTMGMAAPWP